MAPLLFPHPLSRTLSGWCSTCLGPWISGPRFWGPFCRLLLSPVLGVCLPLLQRCHQQPLLLARLRCPLQVRRLLLLQPLRPLCPVDVSVLRSLPSQSGAVGGRLVGRGPIQMGSVVGGGGSPFPCSLCPFGQCVCLLLF